MKTNGLAVASMVLSLCGLVFLVCDGIGVVPCIIGTIFGHVARNQIPARREGGGGMATAGIAMGWIGIGLVLLGVVLVFAAGVDLSLT